MTFNGYAVALNGVTLTTCATQAEWDELVACSPAQVFDVLDAIPEGLHPPGLRTEDVTFPQRDGAAQYQDWFQPRAIIVRGTFGPTASGDDCESGDCGTVREQLMAAVQAWQRTNLPQELVVFTDCYLPDLTDGINVYTHGTFDVNTDGWTAAHGAAVARVTTPVHSGAGALRVTWATDPVPYDDPATSGQSAVGATYAATTGERYQVTAWLYAATGEPMPVFGVADSTGVNAVYSDPVNADDTWHEVSVDFLVPESGELVPFVVNGEATTSGDLAYVDDVEIMLYTEVNRTLNGPFGVVGRPRAFEYTPPFRDDQVVPFTALFIALDQRMYVLDECGTPGFTECVRIDPGSIVLSLCPDDDGNFCPNGSGLWCFTDDSTGSSDSVAPVDVAVAGTQKVYPTITLFPGLTSPRIENVTNGDWLSFDGPISDLPVTINTELGTAFDSEGNSLTYLLRGNLFMSLDPGNYEFRMLAQGEDATTPGYATLCFRPTVIAA